ncbi:hypothetical protein BIZ78_gp087 [Erwinia phage vB_EamM_Caitlin]|uniref:hypothetical protein n=1 Tax=Erwinia phage vB_EamM_Caitlin TaxID=1883379 RepID=UPI00081CEB9F|nr:hypothetical protein BIZ78_gp087 [Erwinia phage vB_EamM_Caitlin]ANZ48488.1 hypothetical protein CAITLIN_193 [Erwinia phage vB_EamM_Caitlin]
MKLYLLCALAFSVAVSAATTVEDLTLKSVVDQRYNPPTFAVCTTATTDCYEVESKEEFTLIHKPGDNACPAGYYFLLNRKEGVVDNINTATCDGSLKLSFAAKSRAIEVQLFGNTVGQQPLDPQPH